jgi:Major capsid protein Gp23
MNLNEEVQTKWGAILEHPELPKIKDSHKRATIAQLLENTERALMEEAGQGGQTSLLSETSGALATSIAGGVQNYDPVLISLVRRAMPNLIAYDICGVQPMTGPTGLIFALRPQYDSQSGANAFYYEANTGQSTYGKAAVGNAVIGNTGGNWGGIYGVNTATVVSGDSNTYNFASGANTAQGEALGSTSNVDFNQMAFSIDKVTVTAKTRALKAEYTIELAQDLKAIHGLDAETELSTILSAEILAEINREIVRTINLTATAGAAATTTAGTFDLDIDSNGRWSVEKFKGLMFQVEREANEIAKSTRRGKGNIIICSSDVASALQMAGVLDYAPALNSNNLEVDDTGNTFAGVLNGRMRVYIDPYAAGNYMTIGYKGSSAFDAGLFYCPYVPLQMVRAVGQDTFQPKIGFKTRYGVVANPFSRGATGSDGTLVQNVNVYYRRVLVNNIL